MSSLVCYSHTECDSKSELWVWPAAGGHECCLLTCLCPSLLPCPQCQPYPRWLPDAHFKAWEIRGGEERWRAGNVFVACTVTSRPCFLLAAADIKNPLSGVLYPKAGPHPHSLGMTPLWLPNQEVWLAPGGFP